MEELSKENLYGMMLHDREWYDNGNTRVERVPGGWVYIFYLDSVRVVPQFVPFNNEFMEVVQLHDN